MRFLTFDLKTKLITSESTFRRSLCGMLVDNMLNSKAEIDLAFFLTLIWFSLVAIGKEFCTTQNFSQPEWKKLWVWNLSTVLRIILKSLDVVSESGFMLQQFEATLNLAPMDVLCILGNQYIIGSNLWGTAMFRSNVLRLQQQNVCGVLVDTIPVIRFKNNEKCTLYFY